MKNIIDFSINLKQHKIVIILNTKINKELAELITQGNTFLICADGGSNRLYQAESQLIPNIIIGDFDSIEQSIKDYYQSKGVKIIQNNDQDNTDMEKAIDFAMKVNPFPRFSLFIYGGFGGRLDHTLANISNFIKYHDILKENKNLDQFVHFGESSILHFLQPGQYQYTIDDTFQTNKGIGLFPINGIASIETKGFKWNLDFSNPLIFGKFTSSSNEIQDKSVEIRNKDSIVFITELQNTFQQYK